MAQLIVRNLDDDIVHLLKQRAASAGRSAEEEHRQILKIVLRSGSLARYLTTIPEVGDDEDFKRSDELPQDLDL